MDKKIHILYTCDNAYLDLTGVSIASVIENNKDQDICFYLATETDDNDNYRKLIDFNKNNKRVEFRYLDCKQYDYLLEEKGFDKWGSNSYYVYWKMFAYDHLDIDELWYLDSDAICINKISYPEIKKSAGAVLDSAHADFNKNANLPKDYHLFNTGSFYVNVRRWKENRCTKKIVDYIKKMDFKPLMCDQDILAGALQNDIEVISPKYNYFAGYDYYGVHNSFMMYSLDKKPFYSEQEITDVKDNVMFYHCLGGVFGRPWEKDNESPIKEEFNKYRLLSAWPDFEKERNMSTLFKVEKFLEVLPDGIYNKVHNLAMKMYLKSLRKQTNG